LAEQCSFVHQVCFTCALCAEAELPGPADPERSWRAINLTSIAKFAAKVFVRLGRVALPRTVILRWKN
jgi:hypothetical protein